MLEAETSKEDAKGGMAYKKFKKLLRGTLVELKDDELDDLADELKIGAEGDDMVDFKSFITIATSKNDKKGGSKDGKGGKKDAKKSKRRGRGSESDESSGSDSDGWGGGRGRKGRGGSRKGKRSGWSDSGSDSGSSDGGRGRSKFLNAKGGRERRGRGRGRNESESEDEGWDDRRSGRRSSSRRDRSRSSSRGRSTSRGRAPAAMRRYCTIDTINRLHLLRCGGTVLLILLIDCTVDRLYC
jgi:hypothetical protein